MAKTMDELSKDLTLKYCDLYPSEVAARFEKLSPNDILLQLRAVPIEAAAKVFSYLSPGTAVEVAERCDDEFFGRLFSTIDLSSGAAVLSRVNQQEREQRLAALPVNVASEFTEFLQYPEDSAGRMMDPNVVAVKGRDKVNDVLNRVRATGNRTITDVCVIDDERRLVGLVALQAIAVSDPTEAVSHLVSESFASVPMLSSREEIVELLDKHRLAALPVVDYDNRLVGIIRYDAIADARATEATEDIQTMFGAGRDEKALSKVSFAIKKRLPWLQINLATAFLAAFVVGLFEDTIARITALAIFLPVVAGQSGNTGAQALSVTMRGLALREVRTRHWLKIAKKEVTIGFLNGLVVAVSTGAIAWLWMGSLGLAAVIGLAMIISMVVAGLSGAVIPVILKALGQDPAMSSSIILTTVTDVVGFLSFLGLAALLANSLNLV